ncbi:MAG: hypothetical protein OXE78_03025 [Gammaproteobacteria bacterium]|nr:hypothetical protein [Gammaproteobacteria bacterium]MCY4358016.1 hypothetical protein [Gammaproteobacteria bacterium]
MHYNPVMTLYNKKYKDDGKLRDQDKVNVERYLLMEDRASATGRGVPFFSGRDQEICIFRTMAVGLAQGLTANATLVVEGPPGAGKTALMCQFMEEMQSWPPEGTAMAPSTTLTQPSRIPAGHCRCD